MKIAILAPSRIPARTANSMQVMKMTQALANLGHEVRMAVPGVGPMIDGDGLGAASAPIAWSKAAARDMGMVSSHTRWFHLYLNGLYWGVYDFGERIDASFAASYLGGTKDEYDAIASKPTEAIDGDLTAYNAMLNTANLPLSSLADSSEQRLRLEKDLDEVQSQVERLQALLASPFAPKAPPAVVQKESEKLAGYLETATKIRSQLQALEQ